MSTITWPGATMPIIPVAIDGYEASFESGTVLHPIAGRASADVTLAPGGLRTGTLRLAFASDEALNEACAAHALPVAFTLQSARATVDMYYVVIDTPRFSLDATRKAWLFEVPFQEVQP